MQLLTVQKDGKRVDEAKSATKVKSLHQRKIEYGKARARIFGEAPNRKFRKIAKLREKLSKIKKAKRMAVETVLMTGTDNRFFAQTLVGWKKV